MLSEYGLNLYWKSLLARVTSYERYGVKFSLDDDGEMTVQVPASLRGAKIKESVQNDRESLLEAVRLSQGLCVCCGIDAARHPARKGKSTHWDATTQKAITADCSSLSVCPMHCTSCWECNLMWKGLVERRQRNGGSQKAREEGSGNDSDTPARRKRQTYADADGDSGGVGVSAMDFTAD